MQILFIFLFIAVIDCKKTKHRRNSNIQPYKDEGYKEETSDFGHVYRDSAKNSHLWTNGDVLNIDDALAVKEERSPQPIHFLSPRDKILHEDKQGHVKNISQNIFYNFEALLERNLGRSHPAHMKPLHPRQRPVNATKAISQNIEEFEEKQFLLKSKNLRNWTTCNEFAKKALFHPDDIVNLNWIPFYMWAVRDAGVAVIHRFTYPTKKLVQHYKTNYGPHLKDINWNQPKLLLNENREVLLIAGDRRGLFHGITNDELPESIKGSNITISTLTLRLKIIDPYLALMYCDDKTSVVMAILGDEPKTEYDKSRAASILNFKGTGKAVFRDIKREINEKRELRKKKVEEESRKVFKIERPHIDLSSLA